MNFAEGQAVNRRWAKTVISVLCSLTILITPCLWASGALFAFETQFEYESANVAWLTDLVFKEDMSSVDGLAQNCNLVAKPEYPYTETAESFAQDVSYYASLYNLNQGAQRSAYLYFFDVLSSQAGGLMAGEISDDDIRIYLESMGIAYPDDAGSDERIVARALYSAMISGAFSGVTSGASLEEVMVSYLASLTGMNMETLREWMPDESVISLDSYILAASRLALWTNGYDVEEVLDEDEIFRLVAVMTIEQLGLSADSSLSFDQLKFKYMAAMLGKKYGVNVDSDRLAVAIEQDALPFYMLQLIGRDYGISVREDNCTYEEAFNLVAENSGIFDIEEGEFYADIKNYELTLRYQRSSIWIYPTAYVSNDSDYVVAIDVNGTPVRNGYYTEVPIDSTKPSQTLAVNVVVNSAKKSSQFVYYVDLRQGTQIAPKTDKNDTSAGENSSNPFISSESLVAQIMDTFGLDASIISYLGTSFYAFTLPTQSVLSYISPSFDADLLFSEDAQATAVDPLSVLSDDQYKAVLDEIGNLSDVTIKGIDGMKLQDAAADHFDITNYITFK